MRYCFLSRADKTKLNCIFLYSFTQNKFLLYQILYLTNKLSNLLIFLFLGTHFFINAWRTLLILGKLFSLVCFNFILKYSLNRSCKKNAWRDICSMGTHRRVATPELILFQQWIQYTGWSECRDLRRFTNDARVCGYWPKLKTLRLVVGSYKVSNFF